MKFIHIQHYSNLLKSFNSNRHICGCHGMIKYTFRREYSEVPSDDNNCIQEKFKKVMRLVPQPVVVVTAASYDSSNNSWLKRGITCSSFTSISLKPPIVSFATKNPSRMHDLLLNTGRFAVHVLAENQVGYAIHFSKPAADGIDQLADISHEVDSEGTPILHNTSAVLLCKSHTVHHIGDHHIWYGKVQRAYNNGTPDQSPLLFYARTFCSIGDETFMQAFENRTLPFEEWTHSAHLRMAWNYVRDHGKEAAVPLVKNGILRFNEMNKDKINRGYHETVTMFYIHMINDAITKCPVTHESFEEFSNCHSYLHDRQLLFEYYSDECINNKDAFTSFLPPDKKNLP